MKKSQAEKLKEGTDDDEEEEGKEEETGSCKDRQGGARDICEKLTSTGDMAPLFRFEVKSSGEGGEEDEDGDPLVDPFIASAGFDGDRSQLHKVLTLR